MRMNRIASLWMAAVAAVAFAGMSQAQAPAGDPAPAAVLAMGSPAPMADTKMTGVDGKEITLAEAAGKKGTMVIFMCNHCPWVKAWQTRIAKIGNTAVSKGIGVVAVNSNDPAAYPEDDLANMKTRAKDLGFKFPYVVDATSDVARAFGATHTPEIYLFDASGKLVYHGAVDDNRDEKLVKKQYLTEAVAAVAAGKPVALAETKSLGCGIKFRGKSES
jgi:cytochrome oxidase Cu insertion factor (SCO1/SenC/PrrC family)